MNDDIRKETLRRIEVAHEAASDLQQQDDAVLSAVLGDIADCMEQSAESILEANAHDLERMEKGDYRYDRLLLTPERIADMVSGVRRVALLPSPLHQLQAWSVRDNGMVIRRVSVPLGVVGVIFEARPNVTLDVSALCLKSGNVCLLKGSRDAEATNEAIVSIIRKAVAAFGLSPDVVMLLPADHEAMDVLVTADRLVDLVIPRGSSGLIHAVREKATVPVIETGAGICHTYFDRRGDASLGAKVIENGKTRRVSVCNALDTLLVHRDRLSDLPQLCQPLAASSVRLVADGPCREALAQAYPSQLLQSGSAEQDAFTEYLSYAMNVFVVDSLEDAVRHINRVASRHSESIITEDKAAAETFQQRVDASCVYVNLPTSFTDGGQFGLGAEIGISTQKLHARGPMGLEALTTSKWLINGHGQIREK